MRRLRPFFPYFGSKYLLAPHYQPPRHDTIVEPFAGSACYSLTYWRRKIVLVDADEVIAGLWSFLVRASPDEILSIPDVPVGDRATEQGWPQEWGWLAGLWCCQAAISVSHKAKNTGWASVSWGPGARARIARQLGCIRHWTVIHGDYSDAPDAPATYFIDPPYQEQGKRYPCQPADFEALGRWCRQLNGQTIVCEREGASWLPFRLFRMVCDQRSQPKQEVVWTSEPDAQLEIFP